MKAVNDVEGLKFILLQDGVDPDIVKQMTIEEVRQAIKFDDEISFNTYINRIYSKYGLKEVR